METLTLIIDLLAVYRITRLVVKDSLLQEVRWWILRRWPSAMTTFPDNIVTDKSPATAPGQLTYGLLESGVIVYESNQTDHDGDSVWLPTKTHKITELIECVYCASIWIAFGVLGLRVWWDWWQYPALALALAGGVALIFSRLDND